MYRFPAPSTAIPDASYSRRPVQLRGRCLTTVPGEPVGSASGHRRDHARRGGHLPDAGVAKVGDVEISIRIERNAARLRELRRSGRPAVAEGRTAAGVGRDDARRRGHLPHAVVGLVGDVDVPGRVHRNAARVEDACGGCRCTVTEVAAGSVAGDGADCADQRCAGAKDRSRDRAGDDDDGGQQKPA